MSWVKVDDRAWSHPKFTALSSNAVRLWLFAMCWCNQHETDGTIPRAALRALGGTSKGADELSAVGLWEKTDSGWTVHDFLKYQPSHEQREKERESGRLRAEQSYRAKPKSSPEESPKNPRSTPGSSAILHPTRPVPVPTIEEREPPVGPPGAETPSGVFAVAAPAKRERKPKAERWSRFPKDFEPDATHRKIAAELGLSLPQQLARIHDHEFKVPRTDPAATLRTWLRNAPQYTPAGTGAALPPRPNAPPRPPSAAKTYLQSLEAREVQEKTERALKANGGAAMPTVPELLKGIG